MSVEVGKTQGRMDRMETNILSEMRSFKSDLLIFYEESIIKGRMYFEKALTHKNILLGHEARLRTLESYHQK